MPITGVARPFLGMILTVGISACEPSPGGPAEWTITDSAGVTLVSNHPSNLPRGCLDLEPQAEMTIRSGDGTAPDTAPELIQVSGGSVLQDGGTAILAAGTRQVLFFDADGRFRHASGRNGRGPGEFLNPSWLGSGGADTLFVWDRSQGRLTVLDGAGTLLATHPVEGTAEHPDLGGRFGDGSFLLNPGVVGFFPRSSGVVRLPEAYGRHDPGTGRSTTLAAGTSLEWSGGYSLPFGKRTVVAANGDHLILADTGVPELRFYDLEGGLRRVVRWPSPPVPVTPQDRAAYMAYYAAEAPRFAPPPDTPFADERPRLTSILGDREGWIWVKMYSGGWEEPSPWLVFDGEGILQCEVEAPARLTVLEIGRSYLLGLLRDSTGEEVVMRWGLHGRE